MKYALLLIENTNEDLTVDGTWMQHCTTYTLEEAIERAKVVEKANNNRIKVAVVDDYCFGIQDYNYKKGLVNYRNQTNIRSLR